MNTYTIMTTQVLSTVQYNTFTCTLGYCAINHYDTNHSTLSEQYSIIHSIVTILYPYSCCSP